MYETEYEERFYRRKDIHTTTDPFIWKILRWRYGGGTMHGCYWNYVEKKSPYHNPNLHKMTWKAFRRHQWK